MKLWKNTLTLLVALIAVFALAGESSAQSMITGDDTEWGSAADSTTTTLANAAADTTGWIDLLYKKFPTASFAGFPLLKCVINTNAASGDSIGIVLQYSPDQSAIFAKSKVYAIGASPTVNVLMTADTHANAPEYGFRYVRAIVSDDDVSRTAAFTTLAAQMLFLTAP